MEHGGRGGRGTSRSSAETERSWLQIAGGNMAREMSHGVETQSRPFETRYAKELLPSPRRRDITRETATSPQKHQKLTNPIIAWNFLLSAKNHLMLLSIRFQIQPRPSYFDIHPWTKIPSLNAKNARQQATQPIYADKPWNMVQNIPPSSFLTCSRTRNRVSQALLPMIVIISSHEHESSIHTVRLISSDRLPVFCALGAFYAVLAFTLLRDTGLHLQASVHR